MQKYENYGISENTGRRGEATNQEKAIEINNLTKMYGNHVGVKDLSLTVHKGEIMGFLGPNGAGKTTTIRCCLALIAKTAGEITIFGLDSHRDAVAIRKKTGYLPGDFGLIPSVKVRSYLKYLLSLNGCSSTKKMLSLAERLQLDLDRKTNELSKGNKLKVGIVQSLMTDEDLIIMDEPSGLDPLMQQEFYRILRQEKKHGKTVFMSSHNLAEVESVCDRVAIIRKGQLVVVEDIQVLQEKTGKVLEVEFRDPFNINEFKFDGVSSIRQDNGRLILTIHENLDNVIKAVSNHQILNMNLKTYSLEQLFLKYYAEEEVDERGDA
ncbi:MAG: ABC transporter ATP-binding protein [Candidatus Bathyarchaeota archaeon]|nr:ABC transporter ATP-binding protein [Candidatus Bathyarchaeota archaeon]MDH5532248.1 ABC transporter ATP-binding protein [Candidatus Bathyarchaeota archaeon]MDH5713820.1 ABC transporter ATP-binding protein [Candidatus Bathyarchaeota archaeon]